MSTLTDAHRKLGFNILCVLCLLFGFCFFISCYISPCQNDTDDGLYQIFKVSGGLSFQVVFTGLFLLALPGYYLRVFQQGSPTLEQLGTFLGLSGMTTLLMLQTAAVWGSQTLMVDDLIGKYSETGGGTASVNTSTRPAFLAVTTFASFLFVFYLILTGFLYWTRNDDFSSGYDKYNGGATSDEAGTYQEQAPGKAVGDNQL